MNQRDWADELATAWLDKRARLGVIGAGASVYADLARLLRKVRSGNVEVGNPVVATRTPPRAYESGDDSGPRPTVSR